MLERFIIINLQGITINRPTYIVCDDLTDRVREVTHDLEDARAIAAWLNAGHVYDGGEPVLAAA